MRYSLILLMGMLTSCCMYKRDFDSCPTPGIPCTSVSTLEEMIVESPCGPDLFLGCVPKLVDVQCDPICTKCTIYSQPNAPFQRRIWISPKNESQPEYIYFNEDLQCDER